MPWKVRDRKKQEIALSAFENVNQHCLDKIVSLAETNVIVAAEDIYDHNGMKLWAKGGRITASLQEKLSNRKLKTPLELSLEIESSRSTGDVVEDCMRAIHADPALSHIAGSRAALAALSNLRMVKLPSALRLLLSAALDKNPKAYRHVLYTIAICAGFASHADLAAGDVEVLLTSALLHDLGEMYINPEYLNPGRALAAKEWSAVAVHPKVSYMVTQDIGKLKEAVGLGVYQHHERLDGSGYPGMLTRERISAIGAIVAAADSTAAILERDGEGKAYQAALAIRVIPEEFLPEMQTFVCSSLRDLAVECSDGALGLAQTKWVVDKLERSQAAIEELLAKTSGEVQASMRMARSVCDNIRKAVRATGIDHLLQTVSSEQDENFHRGEVSHVARETGWRLRNLARNIYLRTELQSPAEQATVAGLIELLESQPEPPPAP